MRRSFAEAAQFLGYSVSHLHHLVRTGKVRPPDRVHPTGRCTYTDEYLESLLAGGAKGPAPDPAESRGRAPAK
jgi:hypothetical protein